MKVSIHTAMKRYYSERTYLDAGDVGIRRFALLLMAMSVVLSKFTCRLQERAIDSVRCRCWCKRPLPTTSTSIIAPPRTPAASLRVRTRG